VRITSTPSPDWFSIYRDGAGATPAARGLLLRHDNVGFAELRADGELIAIGRGTVDETWLGVTAVEVVPAARRRGYAGLVMSALHDWGVARGALRAHLEVSSSNVAALALYRRLNFHIHHDYRYRTAPPA
jgi:ribosomal protein S18 acetylase RimI-like enzyme